MEGQILNQYRFKWILSKPKHRLGLYEYILKDYEAVLSGAPYKSGMSSGFCSYLINNYRIDLYGTQSSTLNVVWKRRLPELFNNREIQRRGEAFHYEWSGSQTKGLQARVKALKNAIVEVKKVIENG